jgi:hypothetical protein
MADLQQVKQLAQQGDPRAIAALLNHALKSDGVKAKVARHGDRLKIDLMGTTPPAQDLLPRITAGLKHLQVTTITQCYISAYQVDQQQPLWGKTVTLTEPTAAAISPQAPSPPKQKTKKSKRQAQSSAPPRQARRVKLSRRSFWQRGIALVFSMPLIVHGSLRLLLTLETQLFGIHNPTSVKSGTNLLDYFSAQFFGKVNSLHPGQTMTYPLLYLVLMYAISIGAIMLGMGLMRYVFQENLSMAKKLSAYLAIAPALIVIPFIITNPYLLLPSKLGSDVFFIHPVTGMEINDTLKFTLLFINLVFLGVLVLLLFWNIIRPYHGLSKSLRQDLIQMGQKLWQNRRNDVIKLSMLVLLLLLVTNPGPAWHVQASNKKHSYATLGEYKIASAKQWVKDSPDVSYHSILLCSWLNDQHHGAFTFGFAGQSYPRGLPGTIQRLNKQYNRLDILKSFFGH